MQQNQPLHVFNINQIAEITGSHRQTVAIRLKHVDVAPGSNARLKLYALNSLLKELMRTTVTVAVENMEPQDRKAWFQSERERLKFEQESRELVPASDVIREFAVMAKAVVQVLETLPDILERDCALSPTAVQVVQSKIDDLRDLIARKVAHEDVPKEANDPEEG